MFNVGDEYLGKNKRLVTGVIRIFGLSEVLSMRFNRSSIGIKPPTETISLILLSHSATESNGDISLQIVSSGSYSEWEHIKYGYIKMISDARVINFIFKHLIISDAVFILLRIASLTGKDVRIMIPNNDVPFG